MISGPLPADSSNNFLSIVNNTRFTTIEQRGAYKKFTEYEIVCQMKFSAGTLSEKEILHKWSVWRRFSEFKILDQACNLSYHDEYYESSSFTKVK